MRIISGKYKGFKFPSHRLKDTRPTTDRAKESLFNILNQKYDFSEINCLDLYAGTGNISFEFLSRGAQSVDLIESNFKCVEYIRTVASKLDLDLRIYKNRVLPQLSKLSNQYDLIFADPPYQSPDYSSLVQQIRELNLLKEGGTLIVEHPSSLNLNDTSLLERRVYGQSTFSFFTFE